MFLQCLVLFYIKTQYCSRPNGINTDCVSMGGNAIVSIRPSVSVCSSVSFYSSSLVSFQLCIVNLKNDFKYYLVLQHFMPFDLKDLEVTRNCLERSQIPRIGLYLSAKRPHPAIVTHSTLLF